MKNTVLNFDKEEVNLNTTEFKDVNISNYFSKDINVYNILTDDDNINDYIDTYKMSDDDRLERISYDLYGTTDYWDILMLINERSSLFEMSYNFDVISEDNTSFVDNYFNSIYSQAPLLNAERIEALSSEYLTDNVSKNETYRYINVVKPSKITQFLTLLKARGYV